MTIDSDIVFFQRPSELTDFEPDSTPNLYNEDLGDSYSMTLDELEVEFHLRPPPRINSGLSLVRRDSINFGAIEEWLACHKLFANRWVTEQTLHALASSASPRGVKTHPVGRCRCRRSEPV